MSIKIILEESIMQRDLPATAGSRMLEGFVAPFDATVVRLLIDSGASIVGRANMDEFGVAGLFGEAAITEAVNAVAGGVAGAALCNDFTGATSRAAAAQGLYYIAPTYGLVSRYGLIPAVPSIDRIGIVCKTPDVGFDILSVIASYDMRDGVMAEGEGRREKGEKGREGEWRVESGELRVESDGLSGVRKYFEILPQIMQILSSAEVSNNISRYDGIKYGYRAEGYSNLNELYTKSRTEAFGAEVKLAAMIGTMVLSTGNYERYYDKAMRLRRLIKESLLFDKYDVLEFKSHDNGGAVMANLCGLPFVTTPECIYIANTGCEDALKTIVMS